MNTISSGQGDNMIMIREAVADDLPDVYRLICALEDTTLEHKEFERVFYNNLKNPGCFYRVAETDGRVIGFISLHLQYLLHHCGAVGEVQEFCIDGSYRRKGVGKCLMNEIRKIAAANNVQSLEVASSRSRTANVPIYESMGFKLTHNKFTAHG